MMGVDPTNMGSAILQHQRHLIIRKLHNQDIIYQDQCSPIIS